MGWRRAVLNSWLILVFLLCFQPTQSFRKVIVPSIFNEYDGIELPDWANSTEMMNKYHYSVKIYQKKDPKRSNFIAFNRGTEAGVYLRYIVDHYHQFPDIAVFIHAHPKDHNARWLDSVRCIRKNATYFNINFAYLTRNTDEWEFMGNGTELWVEQCWREVLKVAWKLEDDPTEFHRRVPYDRPIAVNFSCCQQFFLSRSLVHRRSLLDWKKLLVMIGEQNACKLGEPDYEHLYSYLKYLPKRNSSNVNSISYKIGPEPATIITGPPNALVVRSKHGTATQGGAMEHLAHVVYGFQPLHVPLKPTMREICDQFYPAEECDSPLMPSSENEKLVSPCIPSQL